MGRTSVSTLETVGGKGCLVSVGEILLSVPKIRPRAVTSATTGPSEESVVVG